MREPDVDLNGRAAVPLPAPFQLGSAAVIGLFVLACLYTLSWAGGFLKPVVVALLLSHLLSPLVRRLRRAGLPETAGASLVLLAFLGTMGLLAYQLSDPAMQWIASAPQGVTQVEAKVRRLVRPFQQVSRTAEKVAAATDLDATKVLQVEIKDRGFGAAMFGTTQELVTSTLVVSLLVFLLLAAGDHFLTKLIKVLPSLQDKKRAVHIARETEAQVSSYLVTTTLVNAGFGAVVALAMYLLQMPNPVLWGVLAAVTNYIPFVGALGCTVTLAFVALIHFDDVGRALLVPAVFQALNLVEGSLVTPKLVGQKLSLSPVVVFLAVLFWGWIWGVAGALLAVPITAVLKIACDRIEGLAALGELLGN